MAETTLPRPFDSDILETAFLEDSIRNFLDEQPKKAGDIAKFLDAVEQKYFVSEIDAYLPNKLSPIPIPTSMENLGKLAEYADEYDANFDKSMPYLYARYDAEHDSSVFQSLNDAQADDIAKDWLSYKSHLAYTAMELSDAYERDEGTVKLPESFVAACEKTNQEMRESLKELLAPTLR